MRTRALFASLVVAVPAMLYAQSSAKPSSKMTTKLTPEQVEHSAIVIDTHADTPQRMADENYDLADSLNGGNWNLETAQKGGPRAENEAGRAMRGCIERERKTVTRHRGRSRRGCVACPCRAC